MFRDRPLIGQSFSTLNMASLCYIKYLLLMRYEASEASPKYTQAFYDKMAHLRSSLDPLGAQKLKIINW